MYYLLKERGIIILLLCGALVLMLQANSYADGLLRKHPTNPRYVTDNSGKAIYLTGSHIWDGIQSPTSANRTFAFFSDFLDYVQSFDHNFVRLWTGWAYLGFQPYPWNRPGPGTASDGNPRFDMKSFNQSYFDYLRKCLQEIEDRGMYCSIMFFGSHNRFKKDFSGVAWQEDNNINSELANAFSKTDGYSWFTTNSAAVEVQRRTLRKFIDEFQNFDNIMWEIMNEPGGATSAQVNWHKGMVNYVKSYEQNTYGRKHLVGMTGGWSLGDNMFSSSADFVSPDNASSSYWQSSDSNGGPASYSNKIIILDTDHLWGFTEQSEIDKI
jgi:hypothetical protein